MAYSGWDHQIIFYGTLPADLNAFYFDCIDPIVQNSNYSSRGGISVGSGQLIHNYDGGTLHHYGNALRQYCKIRASGAWVNWISSDGLRMPLTEILIENPSLPQDPSRTMIVDYWGPSQNESVLVYIDNVHKETFYATQINQQGFSQRIYPVTGQGFELGQHQIYFTNPTIGGKSDVLYYTITEGPAAEHTTPSVKIVRILPVEHITPAIKILGPTEHTTPGIKLVRIAPIEHISPGIQIVRLVPTEHVTLGIQIARVLPLERFTPAISISRIEIPVGPPPTECKQPTSILDITGWISYYGCLISEGLKNINSILTGAFGSLKIDLTGLFPDWLKDSLSGIGEFLTWITAVIRDPKKILSKLVQAAISESSPSLLGDFTSAYQEVGVNLQPKFQDFAKVGLATSLKTMYESTVTTYLGQLLQTISRTDLSPEEMQTELQHVIIMASADVESLALCFEMIPWVSLTAIGDAAKASLDYLGADSIRTDYVDKLIKASAGRQWTYAANKKFPTEIPALDQLSQLRRIGQLSTSQFLSKGTESTGIEGKTLDAIYQGSLAPPALDDIITWNARHSGQAISISQVMEYLGMRSGQAPAFGVSLDDIIAERQYTDIPLRTVRAVYSTGVMSEGDLDNVLTRHMLRKDLLPGQSMSDFAIMKAYAVQGKALADAKKEPKAAKTKLFTPQALVSLLADGILTQPEADLEIEKYAYDQSHKELLKKWVAAKAAAKKPDIPRTSATK